MDLVTDIVNSLHLRAIVQDTVRASAPWGLKFTPGATSNDAKHPGAKVVSQHVVAHFHMVEGGSCWLIQGWNIRQHPTFGRRLFSDRTRYAVHRRR